MVSANISFVELVFVNLMLVLSTWAIERMIRPKVKKQSKRSYKIIYDRLENIKPSNKLVLMDDLKDRTGLDIIDVKISEVDFSQNKAYLQIFYLKA